MQDFFGRPLQIGDHVAFKWKQREGYFEGEIIAHPYPDPNFFEVKIISCQGVKIQKNKMQFSMFGWEVIKL